MYDAKRGRYFISQLNEELGLREITADLVVPTAYAKMVNNPRAAKNTAEVIDAFLGLILEHDVHVATEGRSGKEPKQEAVSVERIQAYLRPQAPLGSFSQTRRTYTGQAQRNAARAAEAERNYMKKSISALAGFIATGELGVSDKIRENNPTEDKKTSARELFNEIAEREHYDDLGGFIRTLYGKKYIDDKTGIGMLFVMGLEPEPESHVLQSSAETHKRYAAQILQGRITATQTKLTISPDLIEFKAQYDAGLQHIKYMFGLPGHKEPFRSLTKLAGETFCFNKTAYESNPVMTERVQKQNHLQRIIRETNHTLHVLFGGAL